MLGFALFSLFAAAIAAPTSNRANLTENYAPGISFDNDKSGLPLLKLPYATYRAAKYDSNTDVSNIISFISLRTSTNSPSSISSPISVSQHPQWVTYAGGSPSHR